MFLKGRKYMADKTTSSVNSDKALERRTFIKQTAAAAAAFVIVPRHVLGGAGNIAPSDKLNIASIGAGGMAAVNIKGCGATENIVALCDVDEKHAKESFDAFPKATRYKDFRVMLEKENKNIDAVIVATPDHIHAVAAMAVLRMGKHVYCQKPLCKTILETRHLMEEARKVKVATQMGNQGHSSEGMKLMCEWIWDGAIGTVREVDVWTTHAIWPQGMTSRPADAPVPGTLDWDLWLGPAPYRPYNPAYAPGLWRGWWDFGTGAVGDMACHNMDPVMTALKLGHPTSVEASCSIFVPTVTWDKPFNNESYPQASIIRYQFPARGDLPPVKMTWYDGGLMPERPAELEEGLRMGDKMGGVIFKGDKGKLMCGHSSEAPRLIPETFMRSYKRPPKTLPRVGEHHEEWIRACKQGTPTGSNFEYAGLLTQVALLGNVALRFPEKKLLWDPENMKITNVPEANNFLHYEYRKGWSI
jgi:hypothetical protein